MGTDCSNCAHRHEAREVQRSSLQMGICQSDEYTEAQVREYCVTHNKGQLYETVQLNLSIEAEHAKDIAAYVAFSLAGGEGSGTITKEQFDGFKKKWVDNPKGNQQFVMHTVFSSQDKDRNGYLDAEELDGLANLFFDGSWLSADDPRMKQFKDKEHFKKLITEKCDANMDGKFSYEEIVGVLSGQLDLTGSDSMWGS